MLSISFFMSMFCSSILSITLLASFTLSFSSFRIDSFSSTSFRRLFNSADRLRCSFWSWAAAFSMLMLLRRSPSNSPRVSLRSFYPLLALQLVSPRTLSSCFWRLSSSLASFLILSATFSSFSISSLSMLFSFSISRILRLSCSFSVRVLRLSRSISSLIFWISSAVSSDFLCMAAKFWQCWPASCTRLLSSTSSRLIFSTSSMLLRRSSSSALSRSRMSLSLRRQSFSTDCSFFSFSSSMPSNFLILPWSTELFLLSLSSSPRRKSISFSVSLIFSAALQKCSCFLLASSVFFFSSVYSLRRVASSAILLLRSPCKAFDRFFRSFSREFVLPLVSSMILSFSARRNSSLLTRFSSAVLLRLSCSICSLRKWTSLSFISLLRERSLSFLLNSLASLIFSFMILCISLILPSSAMLFLRSSSSSCLSSWMALSFFCLVWLLPSICFSFSFRMFSSLRMVASSAMLLLRSFSISVFSRVSSRSSSDLRRVSSFRKYIFSLSTFSNYLTLFSSTMLLRLSASRASSMALILSSVLAAFSPSTCCNLASFCSSAMDFLLSLSISFLRKRSSSSLRLDLRVSSSMMLVSFFSLSLISSSILRMQSSVCSFSFSLFSSMRIISSRSLFILLKLRRICSSFIMVVLRSSSISAFTCSRACSQLFPFSCSCLTLSSSLLLSSSRFLYLRLSPSSLASVSLRSWSAMDRILSNSSCSSSFCRSSSRMISAAFSFSAFILLNSLSLSLISCSSSLAFSANSWFCSSIPLVLRSAPWSAFSLSCFSVSSSLSRSLTFCSASKFLELQSMWLRLISSARDFSSLRLRSYSLYFFLAYSSAPMLLFLSASISCLIVSRSFSLRSRSSSLFRCSSRVLSLFSLSSCSNTRLCSLSVRCNSNRTLCSFSFRAAFSLFSLSSSPQSFLRASVSSTTTVLFSLLTVLSLFLREAFSFSVCPSSCSASPQAESRVSRRPMRRSMMVLARRSFWPAMSSRMGKRASIFWMMRLVVGEGEGSAGARGGSRRKGEGLSTESDQYPEVLMRCPYWKCSLYILLQNK